MIGQDKITVATMVPEKYLKAIKQHIRSPIPVNKPTTKKENTKLLEVNIPK